MFSGMPTNAPGGPRTFGLLPTSTLAWTLTVAGLAALLLSAWLSVEAFDVVFGRAPNPGGGEFFTALFGGVPTLLLGALLVGVSASRPAWRSGLALVGVVAAVILVAAWVVVLLRWA